jgi:hypothetical protein
MIDLNELDDAFGDPSPEPNNSTLSELDDAFADTPPKPKEAYDITQFLKERGYWLHECHPVGHHIYPRGCTRIEYRDEIIRYADVDQLAEMEAARQRGFTDELMAQIEGIGNPIVESSKGDYGSLKAECEWIETHDNVFINYMGTDENWPDGCYAIESGKSEPDYYDPDQIKYIAYEILGMPIIKTVSTRTVRVNGRDRTPITESVTLSDDDPLGLDSAFENPQSLINEAAWGELDALFE